MPCRIHHARIRRHALEPPTGPDNTEDQSQRKYSESFGMLVLRTIRTLHVMLGLSENRGFYSRNPKRINNGGPCIPACVVRWILLSRRAAIPGPLGLKGACDLDSANRVLRRFVADCNRRFARTPREAPTAWRPAPEHLERICAFRHERVVSNDNLVQWEGCRLQIPPQHRRFSFAGAKVQLYQALDGRLPLLRRHPPPTYQPLRRVIFSYCR